MWPAQYPACLWTGSPYFHHVPTNNAVILIKSSLGLDLQTNSAYIVHELDPGHSQRFPLPQGSNPRLNKKPIFLEKSATYYSVIGSL